ncbi:thiamine pyrophosphate-binding protein [Thermodesulfobacteriota bacterium]
MGYTGGEALVEVLKQQEVKAIFSSPGSEWVPVWEALARLHAQGNQEPKYFNCRHEMLAASAAIGYAQKGGGLPAVLFHSSTGLLHGAMAVRGAYKEQVPMLVFSGEAVRFTEDKDPKSGKDWQWLSSLSDVGGSSRMAAPFVKWSQAVTSRETLSATIARACQMARMAPQGPVFLSVSKEYLQEELEEIIPRMPVPRTYCTPDPDDMEKIAALLMDSRNPILITERIGAQPKAMEKLVEFAEALAIPVFECMYQDYFNFPKEHPLHAGFDVTQAIREADVVLVVAATTPWNPQRTNPGPEARVLIIDNQAPYYQAPFWNYRADMIVAADPLPALEALVDLVKGKSHNSAADSDRFGYWKARHDQLIASWDQDARRFRQKKPIDPNWLCYAVNESLPANAIVVRETITHTGAIKQYIRRIRPGNFYKGNVGGLGSGMGVALGAKLASSGQPVVHLVGDGSFNYAPVLSALGFSQEYRLPVLTVVFNNGAYRAMKSGHLRLYPEGWALRNQTFYGVDIVPSPDYAQLMKAFDAYGEKVEDPGEITPALDRAWQEVRKGRSALLDVVMDPEDPR